MEIKTKFNIGDKVYYVNTYSTKIEEGVVEMITASMSAHSKRTSYMLKDCYMSYIEEQLFSSKDELLEKMKQSLD